jgi:hypothetical protein
MSDYTYSTELGFHLFCREVELGKEVWIIMWYGDWGTVENNGTKGLVLVRYIIENKI